MLLKASLGVRIDASQHRIAFSTPQLPEWLDTLSIFDLEINGATIDVSVVRNKNSLSVNLLRGDGSVHVTLR